MSAKCDEKLSFDNFKRSKVSELKAFLKQTGFEDDRMHLISNEEFHGPKCQTPFLRSRKTTALTFPRSILKSLVASRRADTLV